MQDQWRTASCFTILARFLLPTCIETSVFPRRSEEYERSIFRDPGPRDPAPHQTALRARLDRASTSSVTRDTEAGATKDAAWARASLAGVRRSVAASSATSEERLSASAALRRPAVAPP